MRRVVALLGLGALLVAATSSGILPGISSASTAQPGPQHVTVIAKEFSFALSKKSVKTGTVIFTVKNKGKLAHDFAIAGKRTPLIAPGKSAILKVTFKKHGQFKYMCTVPGHAAAGMKGVLSVGVSPKSTATHPDHNDADAGQHHLDGSRRERPDDRRREHHRVQIHADRERPARFQRAFRPGDVRDHE